MKIISVDGAEAHLLWSGDDYFLRIYHRSGLSFKDCKIKHSDLTIVIDDEDAYLYEDKDGDVWIDHSPQTLGLEIPEEEWSSDEMDIENAFQEYLKSIRAPTDPSRPKAIPYKEEEFDAFRAAWKKARE